VQYTYFDLAADRYLAVSAPAGSVPVASAAAATAAALPPRCSGSAPVARRLLGNVPDWSDTSCCRRSRSSRAIGCRAGRGRRRRSRADL
jgi:hypothetical protein